jgi:hypothetical protein
MYDRKAGEERYNKLKQAVALIYILNRYKAENPQLQLEIIATENKTL